MMKCYLCGKVEHELVSEKLRYDAPRKAFKCNNCSLVFLYPQMTPQEERIFYEREYGEIYSSEKGTTPQDLFNARLKDAKDYFNLTRDYLDKTDDCLEIGCASGYFLATIKESVRSVAGVESHNLLRQYCEGIDIRTFETLEKVNEGEFDKAFMFFLLEHLGDPVGFLKKVRKTLKRNGMLFIEVPNVEDVLLSTYNIPAFKAYYFTPAHQFYYSKKTLSDVLIRAGFTDFEIKPVQRYDLSNHMHWMMTGKPGGMGKYDHIFSQELRKAYSQDLVSHNICDTLFAVVKQR